MTLSEKRARAGRLGAASLHSQGKTNTTAARAAFMARFEREVDPAGVLSIHERERRAQHARVAYFTRLSARRNGA